MRYPVLTIEHNHGVLNLANASFDSKRNEVIGKVISGGSSYRTFEQGTTMSWNIWREPHPVMSYGYLADDGRWHETPTPGAFRVSTVLCG